MAKIGTYTTISPDQWLFPNHGDVKEGKRRAEQWFQKHQTYEGAEQEIEEFVRQWALKQLIDVYEYPKAWLGEKLQIEESVKMGSSEKQADIAIKNDSRRVFLYIEVKKGNINEAEFLEAQKQLESYLAATHTATIGMVTNGTKIKCIQKKIDPNDFHYIPDIPLYSTKGIASKAKLIREIPKITKQSKTGLTPLSNNYEKLLFQCHSAIRDTDGSHADEALDELCKIIYSKIYDERDVISKTVDTEFKFQIYGSSNTAEVASNIRELYDSARKKDIEIYSKRIPDYERSRGVFKKSLSLSDIAIYKVVEKLQAYSFIDSETDIKGRAFQGVLSSAIRAGMGQYFTPDPIVELAVRIIQPKPTDLILDPFCGSGHFLTKSLDYVREHSLNNVDVYTLHQFKFFHLHGIEKSDRMVRIAMTDMMLHDDGHTNIRNTDALLTFDNYPDILQLENDTNSNPAVFDLILTNPPFGSLLVKEMKEIVGRFELGQKKKSIPAEYAGLERSLQFLKPGGKLAIVLPDGVLKNKNSKYVRNWLKGIAQLKAVISLPEESFQPFGAMVKTSLCIFQKYPKGGKTAELGKEDVLLVDLENIGYDATGRPQKGSEIDEVVQLFYKEVTWFEAPKND